jgi:hypothetical protein
MKGDDMKTIHGPSVVDTLLAIVTDRTHPISQDLRREFEDRGRRWAHCLLYRLRRHSFDVPFVWPGTREQAGTIVHAFAPESLSERQRELLVDVVQSSARAAWPRLIAAPAIEGSRLAN